MQRIHLIAGATAIFIGSTTQAGSQEAPQFPTPTIPTVDTNQLFPPVPSPPAIEQIQPVIQEAQPLVAPAVPTPTIPVVDPGEAQLGAPVFNPIPFNAPTFNSPAFTAPTFSPPAFAAPAFSAPTFSALQTGAPQFTAPTFSPPTFAAPAFSAPNLTAPTLTFIQAPPEASVQPVTIPAATIPEAPSISGN